MEDVLINDARKQKMQTCTLPTLIELFYQWEEEKPQEVFLRQPIGSEWKEYTWAEVGQEARRMASALMAMDFPPKSHIALVSKNCAHWIICDLAIMMAGHVSVPLFPTLVADQLQQVLEHSDSRLVFIGKLDNWEIMKEGVPDSLPVITFPEYRGGAPVKDERFQDWDEIVAKHEPLKEKHVPKHSDLITICYTSGTTGMPKGVMLSYYAFAQVNEAVKDHMDYTPPVAYFSYLPLNHMAERLVVEAACLGSGGCISFAESLDTFAQNLAETQPTHFLAVPRIWTKFQQGVLSKMPASKLNFLLKIPFINQKVKKKIRLGLGLDRARYVLTGAAPMPESLFSWYRKLGIPIREGYGMSENTACCSSMWGDNIKFGTVGKPQPGVDIKIDPDTGEILMNCEWVMEGYYKAPDLTDRVLKDGWLHTGDKGELDSDGYLKITGRVKEIFKTAKGEYVSPFTLESGFALNSHIEQMCVVGSGLPQPMAILILSEEGQKASRAEVEAGLLESLEEVNQKVFPYERIQRLIVVPDEWSVDTGVMTPTLKIKRNKVEDQYGPHFEKWYEAKEKIIWA